MREIFNFLNFEKKTQKNEQELQEVLMFPIEIFWNLEASLKSNQNFYISK